MRSINPFVSPPIPHPAKLRCGGSPSEIKMELGMIVIDLEQPERRWQGSAAVEQIAALLPTGSLWLALYRNLPGLKLLGDWGYAQIRDHRYEWFGRRDTLYLPAVCERCRDPLTEKD